MLFASYLIQCLVYKFLKLKLLIKEKIEKYESLDVMHDKGQEINPPGISLNFKLRAVPSEFDKTWAKFTDSIQVGPL